MNEFTPEEIRKAKIILGMMTDDHDEMRRLVEGLSEVSRNSEGLAKLSAHSDMLLKDATHAKRWKENWVEVSDLAKRVAVIGAALAVLGAALRWLAVNFGGSASGPSP